MHGDFAPWNLRETSRGRFLIDWEDCGWGPPGADEVFYRAAQTALGLGDATASPHAEAIEYWKSKIADRRDGARDARLAAGMNEALDRMRPSTVREPALGSGEQGERPRVLVFAYACEPGLGSEPGAGWGLVRALSEFANCVVLTAAVHVAALRVAAGLLPEHAIDVVAVAEPRWAPFARKHRVTWFLLYLLWLRRARATARDLATSTPFDVVHHATYSTYWLPSPVADFSAPAVWGAVGGAVTTPFRLWGYLGWTGIFDEILDFVAVKVMALLPATRRTWRRAAVRIVQNEATLWALPHALRSRTWVLNHAAFTQVPRGAASQRGRDLLLVASLESRKGVSLALHAVACASRGVRLTIVGDGPRRRSLERLARRLRVAGRVTFRGRVPRAEVVALLDAAAAVVFTGMREEGGVALAEAMLCGAPVIVLANGGARTLAAMGTDATRVALIEPGGPKDTARRMGDAMTRFAENPPLSRAPLLDQAAAVRALRLAFQQAWSVPMPGVARVTQPVDAPTAPRE
jgi:glycosyltransferase involved in cell wall biosynthesis